MTTIEEEKQLLYWADNYYKELWTLEKEKGSAYDPPHQVSFEERDIEYNSDEYKKNREMYMIFARGGSIKYLNNIYGEDQNRLEPELTEMKELFYALNLKIVKISYLLNNLAQDSKKIKMCLSYIVPRYNLLRNIQIMFNCYKHRDFIPHYEHHKDYLSVMEIKQRMIEFMTLLRNNDFSTPIENCVYTKLKHLIPSYLLENFISKGILYDKTIKYDKGCDKWDEWQKQRNIRRADMIGDDDSYE